MSHTYPMTVTTYFDKAIHFERSSVVDELFGSITGLIFEKDPSRASIEARCWSAASLQLYDKKTAQPNQHGVSFSVNPSNPSTTITSSSCSIGGLPQRQEVDQLDNPQLRVLDLDLTKLRQFIKVSIGTSFPREKLRSP